MYRIAKSLAFPAMFLLCSLVLEGVSQGQAASTSNAWVSAGQMTQARTSAAAALLQDGRILITGGTDAYGAPAASAEFYDPTTGAFTAAPAMNVPRANHAAIVLSTGDVLVTGGVTDSGGDYTNTAEIYNASTQQWSQLQATLGTGLAGHAMANLPDGNVLIAGGRSTTGPVGSLLLFKLSDQSIAPIGSLLTARTNAAAASTPDGRVLIAGGTDINNAVLSSTEIFVYSPTTMTGTISAGPAMSSPRTSATATSTYDGVAIIGGYNVTTTNGQSVQTDLGSAEIFSQWTNAFRVVNGGTPRSGHFAVLLRNNGAILSMGGTGGQAVDLLQPWTNNTTGAFISAAGSLSNHAGGFAAPASVGSLLAAGGQETSANAAELYLFPTIATDQPDYAPGTTVLMTGTGFQPGETVDLHMHIWVDQTTTDLPDYTVTVGDNGSFSFSGYAPNITDIGARYHLTAVGESSGYQAQTVFTDAGTPAVTCNPSSVAVNSPTTCTATIPGQGGSGDTINWTATPANDGTFTTTPPTNPPSCKISNGKPGTCSVTYTPTAAPAGGHTITATDGNKNGAFLLGVYGTASKLAFSVQPSAAAAGSAISPSVEVSVEDANGNVVTNSTASVSISIATNPGGGTLSGTTPVSAVAGVATFSNLSINKTGTGYTLAASSSGLSGATSNGFNIAPGAAASVTATAGTPQSTTINTAFATNLEATVEDAFSNPVSGVTVTFVVPGSGARGTFTGTNTATTNTSGVATANTFTANGTAGSYSVTASAAGVSTPASFSLTNNNPTPTLASISPTSGNLSNSSLNVVYTGTNFINGVSSVSFAASGITVNSTTVNSSTKITANISIASNATVGAGDVSVTNSGPGGGTATLTNGFTVNSPATATSVISSQTPSTFGQPVTFTATVSSANGTPTGSVTFVAGSTCPGTALIGSTNPVNLSGGVASFTTSALPAGTNQTITGCYSPTGIYVASNGSVSQTVNQATTSIMINAPTVTYNANGSATVTVTSAAGTVTGNVSLSVDGGAAVLKALSSGSAIFTNSDIAALASASAGNHTLSASYAAQGNFAGSGPTPGTLTVNQAATSTSLSAPTVIAAANGVVMVTVSSTAGTPTGNATLAVDGGSPLSAPLTGGTAPFTLTSPSPGIHNLSASFSAQGNFAASGPTTGTLTVELAPSITSSASTTFGAGALGAFTATSMAFPTAAWSEVGVLPSGVMFTDNGNGTATLSGTALVAGSYPITLTAFNGVGTPAMQPFVLTVSPGNFTQLQILVPGETAAPGTENGKTGTPSIEYVNGPFNVTVNAVDQYWNLVSTVTDTVEISSNDTQAIFGPVSAALVAGTSTYSVTPESVSYNPSTTTVTASDSTTISSATSQAIEVIIVYTASIAPADWATGQQGSYTLTVSNAPAPNTNNLESVQIAVPIADQGNPISNVVVTPANWTYDSSKPGIMRFVANSTGAAVTPGGIITFTFNATSSATVISSPVPEIWNTTAYSDLASTNPLPLARPEPTVELGAAPQITSDVSTTAFTYGTSGTTFVVTTTGVPTPSLSESGSFPAWATFKDKGDGTATISGTPTAAGTSTFTITAHNGFGNDATQSFTLTVNPAPLSITAGSGSFTYGGTPPTINPSLTAGSAFVGSDSFASLVGLTCSTTATNTSHVNGNPYTSSCSGATDSDYTVSYVNGTVTVNAAPLSITASSGSFTYGGTPPTINPSLTAGNAFVGSDSFASLVGLTCSTTATSTSHVSGNPYTSSCSGANDSDYTVSYVNGTVTVNAAPLSITASSGSFTYGGTPPTINPSLTAGNAFVGSDSFASLVGLTCSTTATSTSHVSGNPYTSSCSGANDSDYTVSYVNGTVTVNAAPLSITASSSSFTYGGTPPTINPSLTAGNAFVGSDSFASLVGLTCSTTATSTSHVSGNPYTSSCSGANDSDYTVSYVNGTVTVNAAPLSITASSGSFTYGGTPPTINPSLTAGNAFVGSDSFASLVGLTCSTTATSTSHVSGNPYTSSCSGANDSDYTVSYVNGTVTVNAAPLSITASTFSFTYGSSVPGVMPGYSGFVNGDGSGTLNPGPTCSTNANSTSPVSGNGNYSSTCSGAVDPDYKINYAPGTVTVTPATTSTTVVSSSPSNTSNFMQVVTFTATVADSFIGSMGTPTGTVAFYSNGTQIGTGTLTAISCGTPPCPSQATISTTGLLGGTDSITVAYSGDGAGSGDTYGDFYPSGQGGSTATGLTQTVTPVPLAGLNPTSLSFGNTNVGKTSSGMNVTLTNTGDAALALGAGAFSFTGTNAGDFAETNNCPSSLGYASPNNVCTVTVTFAPSQPGAEYATLQITDNDQGGVNVQQYVSLSGSGLSTIAGTSLYTDAIFATSNSCGAITVSGGSSVNSFDSSLGYANSKQNSGGNVGTNGNLTLNGGNSAIYGTAALDTTTTGNCNKNSFTGLSSSGGAQVTGGLIPLNGPISFGAPAAPSPVPPTTTQNIAGACPTGMTGCTSAGSKTVTLVPGQYGNVTASGGTTVHVTQGIYNLNSLTLSGKSVLHVDSGPVIVNLAGASLSGNSPAMDVSGGSIENPSHIPANLQFAYGGPRGLSLTGGSDSYATVDAPNALVNLSGGSDFYGSIIGGAVTSSGGTAVHYDSNLPYIHQGNTIWFSAVANNLKNLPANQQVKLYLTNGSISFTANGIPYTVPTPNAVVTFNSLAPGASTMYDAMNSRWSTNVNRSALTGNTFVTGVAFQVPGDFPTGIQNVTWSASFSTDTPGFTLQWQWSAGVYTQLSSAYADFAHPNFLGVNPEDGSADPFGTDPAGTPESYKQYATFGATGGYFSAGAGVAPTVAQVSASPSSLNFGTQSVGVQSSPQTVSLTNNYSAAFTISSITRSGTDALDFTVSNVNCPTTSGGFTSGLTCTISVTFTPTYSTAESAKIVINDTANNSPQTVYLSGTGQ